MNQQLHTSLLTHLASLTNFLSDELLSSVAFKDVTSFSDAEIREATFYPALMLGIISRIPSPDLDPIKELLFNYLLTQKSSHFTWSYWNRASPDASA
jgi:hypothetical protein